MSSRELQRCTVVGCCRPAGLAGICAPHFARQERLAANRSVRTRQRECAVPECAQAPLAEELCERHLLRRRLQQQGWSRPPGPVPDGAAANCAVPACERTAYRLELCRVHFARWRSGIPDWAAVAVPASSRRCRVAECGRAVLEDDLCAFHHRRRALGVRDWDAVPMCDVEACEKRVFARSLCRTHYERLR